MDEEVSPQSVVDPAWLADVRGTAEDILIELDRMQLCQAAAYLSIALDLLDQGLVDPVDGRQKP